MAHWHCLVSYPYLPHATVTGTLKSVEEAQSVQDNHAMIQVLKDKIASKWSDLQDVQGTMCTLLEDEEIETECSSHNDYELRAIWMSKMTKYLEYKSVSEVKTDSFTAFELWWYIVYA